MGLLRRAHAAAEKGTSPALSGQGLSLSRGDGAGHSSLAREAHLFDGKARALGIKRNPLANEVPLDVPLDLLGALLVLEGHEVPAVAVHASQGATDKAALLLILDFNRCVDGHGGGAEKSLPAYRHRAHVRRRRRGGQRWGSG